MKIRIRKPKDCPRINDMMTSLIDEIYAREPARVRRLLKSNFTREALEQLCAEEHAVLYVAESEEFRAEAFLFGWLFHGVLTVYWIYCEPEYRGRGTIRRLLNRVETDLIARGGYKIEMYTYADHNRFLDFSSRLGFRKGVLIRKNMFGVKLRKVYKCIGNFQNTEMEKRIKILGEAGQGVKLLSYTLASILTQLGNEVSLNLEYDSAVRSGRISADLIYSDTPIENPVIDEADVLIKFTRTRDWFPARNLIIDESICGTKHLQCEIRSRKGAEYGFQDVAVSKFGSKMYINMIALGRILRYIGINILLLNIEDLLPPKSVAKNLAALKYGFQFRDDV